MEIQILHWFESLHNPITDPIMYFITTLGNGGIFWIILAAAMLIILPKRYKKVGLSMAIALILSLIFCNGIMKHMWARPRAFWVEGQNFVISNNFENLYGIFQTIHDYSFPSGHSSASFIHVAEKRRNCSTCSCCINSCIKTIFNCTLSYRCISRNCNRHYIWHSCLLYHKTSYEKNTSYE